MMANIHPKFAVSNFVGKIKGKTSYFLRREFWPDVKKKLWGKHFWSPSYCVVSCGGAPLDIVKKYIENQRVPTLEKHAKKSMEVSKAKNRRPQKPRSRR